MDMSLSDRGESPITGYIVPILTHLPPQDTLRTITIAIGFANRHKRETFLLELYTHLTGELLAKFPKLISLCFRVPERGASGCNAERWQTLIDEHMSKLREAVPIAVEIRQFSDERCALRLGHAVYSDMYRSTTTTVLASGLGLPHRTSRRLENDSAYENRYALFRYWHNES